MNEPHMYRFEQQQEQYEARIQILKRGNSRTDQKTRVYETLAALKPEPNTDDYEGIDGSWLK